MKEVTEWNGKPRWMWCWFNDENDKRKEYVVHILTKEEMMETDTSSPVMSTDCVFMHCAEIEEEETRLNNYEMGQLLKCFGVEWKCKCNAFTETSWSYTSEEDREIPDLEELKIRYKQGEWEEPTRETVLKWCEESVNPSGFADIERFFSFIGWNEE